MTASSEGRPWLFKQSLGAQGQGPLHEVLIVLRVAALKLPVVRKVVLQLGLHPPHCHRSLLLLLPLIQLL